MTAHTVSGFANGHDDGHTGRARRSRSQHKKVNTTIAGWILIVIKRPLQGTGTADLGML
jgi:hypothetical protein